MDSKTRQGLLIDYEELSRQRNGINPKLSLHRTLTDKMNAIKLKLKDYEDAEQYSIDANKKRKTMRKNTALRNYLRTRAPR